MPSPPQRNGDPPATPPVPERWVSRSPPLPCPQRRNSVEELTLLTAGHREICLISSRLNIPLSSLRRGAWTQAILEQMTCGPTINEELFFLLEVQAPLDLSTCTWPNQQLLRLQAHLQTKLQRTYYHMSDVTHNLAWRQHDKATPPEPRAGCPPPHSATATLLPHPQCLSAGCRGRPP